MSDLTLSDADIAAIADAVADKLGLAATSVPMILTVKQAAEYLGRSADWIYDHQKDLGAFRYGSGRRAPIGFLRTSLDEWIARAKSAPPPPAPPRRRQRAQEPDPHVELIPFDPQED